MPLILLFLLTLSIDLQASPCMFHHELSASGGGSYEWRQQVPEGFDELIVSWNAERPGNGAVRFYISLDVGGVWSPWMLYASWLDNFQFGNKCDAGRFPASVNEDCVDVLEGKLAQGFRVLAVAEDGADLERIRALHACASQRAELNGWEFDSRSPFVDLDVEGLSQMTEPQEVRNRICSPTSMTAVIRFLQKSHKLEILEFAAGSYDQVYVIYGNWVLNTANAYTVLGDPWRSWVERLKGFAPLYSQLQKGIPVIVSVRGPLAGSALSYRSGHLLVVKGYDPETEEVLCMDPAFSSDAETLKRYRLVDFLEAWGRRQFVSYQFSLRLP